jgi:hypothetical protein
MKRRFNIQPHSALGLRCKKMAGARIARGGPVTRITHGKTRYCPWRVKLKEPLVVRQWTRRHEGSTTPPPLAVTSFLSQESQLALHLLILFNSIPDTSATRFYLCRCCCKRVVKLWHNSIGECQRFHSLIHKLVRHYVSGGGNTKLAPSGQLCRCYAL